TDQSRLGIQIISILLTHQESGEGITGWVTAKVGIRVGHFWKCPTRIPTLAVLTFKLFPLY
ncbi:MAG: hypothetical protein ACKV1O_17225, partial [Saprospiraceae bacterium]